MSAVATLLQAYLNEAAAEASAATARMVSARMDLDEAREDRDRWTMRAVTLRAHLEELS